MKTAEGIAGGLRHVAVLLAFGSVAAGDVQRELLLQWQRISEGGSFGEFSTDDDQFVSVDSVDSDRKCGEFPHLKRILQKTVFFSDFNWMLQLQVAYTCLMLEKFYGREHSHTQSCANLLIRSRGWGGCHES